jgi:hypothetical protein
VTRAAQCCNENGPSAPTQALAHQPQGGHHAGQTHEAVPEADGYPAPALLDHLLACHGCVLLSQTPPAAPFYECCIVLKHVPPMVANAVRQYWFEPTVDSGSCSPARAAAAGAFVAGYVRNWENLNAHVSGAAYPLAKAFAQVHAAEHRLGPALLAAVQSIACSI